MKMRDLNAINAIVEEKIESYLEGYDFEEDTTSVETEIEFELDGVCYYATVEADVELSFEKCYENDKYGIDVYVGTAINLDSFNFYIIDLWDNEIEEYVIQDYKQTEKW